MPDGAEYNRTNTAMEELLGVHETAQYSGEGTYFNTTVFWVRQDLPYVAMLDTVDLKPTTREHFAEQVRPSQADVSVHPASVRSDAELLGER